MYPKRFLLIFSTSLLLATRIPAEEQTAVKRIPLPSAEVIAKLPPDGGEEFNRLVFETSPYLRQHARNPVDWYPWGEEAFAKAKAENKPIFLSVGYSACHWCHVMEHESFEDQQVAKLLNDKFISIKVDREERPDVDAIYMTATQIMTGHGGWPNTIFMDHEKRPFFCGTYFPKNDMQGRPGFVSVLHQLSDVWHTRKELVNEQAARIAEALQNVAARKNDSPGLSEEALVPTVLKELKEDFDAVNGGMDGAPKFPPHQALSLMLTQLEKAPETPELAAMVTTTLDKMGLGGIHDHIGGGFHRYATDSIWFLPHFEKMLYDNGQLASVYARAAVLFKNERYRHIAEELCDWVIRDMQDAGGGFHSALDADSEGEEGKFYLWSYDEVLQHLGPESGAVFAQEYQILPEGNYYEEATGKRIKTNIPHLKEFPERLSLPEQESLAAGRKKLREIRAQRVWPARDDKVLSGWNGLMISGLARSGQLLNRPDYIDAARKASDFILTRMMVDGHLLRTYREGSARIPAYLEDYSFVANGLLDLHEATGEVRWLEAAKQCMTLLEKEFKDPENGGFFFTGHGYENLLTRDKDPFDNATPSGNGMAARAYARLAHFTGEPRYADDTRALVSAFASLIERSPRACATLIESTVLLPARKEEVPEHSVAQAHRDPVTLHVILAPEPADPEGFRSAELQLAFKPHWHAWPNPPPQSKLEVEFIPVKIVAGNGETTLQDVRWPAGKPMHFELMDEDLAVYADVVRVPFKVKSGAQEAVVRVSWQSCDDQGTCLPEVSVELSFLLK